MSARVEKLPALMASMDSLRPRRSCRSGRAEKIDHLGAADEGQFGTGLDAPALAYGEFLDRALRCRLDGASPAHENCLWTGGCGTVGIYHHQDV